MNPAFYIPPMLFCVLAIPALGQNINLPNAGFEDGLENWDVFVEPLCQISSVDEAFEGQNSCLISNREFFWTGISRDLLDSLTVGNEYKISFRAKPLPKGNSTNPVVKVEFIHTDDLGRKFIEVGKLLLDDGNWAHFEGGFNLKSSGQLVELRLKIGGEIDFLDDFLVDDFQIEAFDWRDEANQRIENHRKSEMTILVDDHEGQPVPQQTLEIQQLRSDFAFGCTMNEAVVSDIQYQDSFREMFDWATFEWRAQWFPVESVQGVEDYSIADATVDFCRDNMIRLRGHAVAWSSPQFVPTWLPNLDDQEIAIELDQRIESVVSRYAEQLESWDVCNEMLAYDFFASRLGPEIRPHIFRRTRLFDQNVPLFTNEFGIITSRFDSLVADYKTLIQNLQSENADIGGIGVQGHFNGNVSAVNIGKAIDELASFDLPIWVSEFDCPSSDPSVRAEQLEDFYRYAFSRPEIDGVIMWGFWAGTHWRGPEASIVDLNWQVNEAGQTYLQLMSQWTTNLATQTDAAGRADLRGFHGCYLATIPHPHTNQPTYHMFCLNPSSTHVQLILDDPETLTIYGSALDDEFEVNLKNQIDSIKLNGQILPLPSAPFSSIQFFGNAGNDTLKVNGFENQSPLYALRTSRLDFDNEIQLRYSDLENVEVRSRRTDDRINIYHSPAADLYVSEIDVATMHTPEIQLRAQNFYRTAGRSSSTDSDMAIIVDTPTPDRASIDASRIYVTSSALPERRYAYRFANCLMTSTAGKDNAVINTPIGSNVIELGPESIHVNLDGKTYTLDSFPLATLNGTDNPLDVVEIQDSVDGDDYVYFRPNNSRFRSADGSLCVIKRFKTLSAQFSSSGNDRARILDTAGNDTLQVKGETVLFTGSESSQFTIQSPNTVIPTGTSGGMNQAQLSESDIQLNFLGEWQIAK